MLMSTISSRGHVRDSAHGYQFLLKSGGDKLVNVKKNASECEAPEVRVPGPT